MGSLRNMGLPGEAVLLDWEWDSAATKKGPG